MRFPRIQSLKGSRYLVGLPFAINKIWARIARRMRGWNKFSFQNIVH